MLSADNILLLPPSVSELEKLLRVAYVKGNLPGWIWPLISTINQYASPPWGNAIPEATCRSDCH